MTTTITPERIAEAVAELRERYAVHAGPLWPVLADLVEAIAARHPLTPNGWCGAHIRDWYQCPANTDLAPLCDLLLGPERAS